MKKFIEEKFTMIVLVISLLGFLKSCGDTREITKVRKEMTDLDEVLRSKIMACVFKVEEILKVIFKPEKINLASLGNKTPHIHWHVIPRFKEDAHFPNSHWGEKLREGLRQAISAEEKKELIRLLNQSLS